jgi:hypothetical protein
MNNVKAIKKDTKKTKKRAIRKKQRQKSSKKNKLIKMAILKKKRPTIKKKESVRLRKSKITSDKKIISKRKAAISAGKKKKKITASVTTSRTKRAITIDKPVIKSKIVRIMGQGQFTVDSKTLKKLNEIDNSIVQLVSNERSNDTEFRRRLTELTDIVTKNGKPLHPKEIIQSDIILPSTDLSIDEAKNLFKSEGVIPEI